MTHKTTMEIKSYSTDPEQADSLLALMDYYGKSNLMQISEEQALQFLEILKQGGDMVNGRQQDN